MDNSIPKEPFLALTIDLTAAIIYLKDDRPCANNALWPVRKLSDNQCSFAGLKIRRNDERPFYL